MKSTVSRPVKEMRPEIKRSWERSQMLGLDGGGELNVPYDPDLHPEERFLQAATPVLDHVGGFLIGARTTVVLTDACGRLLARRCTDRALRRRLDAQHSMPGFCWGEEYSGTNAIGIALEERMPTWVAGGEHYFEALRNLACAAVPVVHPITQRLQGAVDVTASLRDASRHMMPIVLQAAQAIEQRLYEDSSESERLLLSRFLSVAKRPGRPIVVLSDRLELSTPPAARLLEVSDKTLLWETAADLIRTHETATKVLALAGGRDVTARFERVELDGKPIGVVIELETAAESNCARGVPVRGGSSASGRRRPEPCAPASAYLGRSQSARYLRHQASELSTEPMPLLLVGAAGVGKLTLAKAIAGDTTERVLIDAARTTIEGESGLLRQVAGVSEAPGRTIIVRRVGCLSARAMQGLSAIADSAEENGSRVIATLTTTPDHSGDGPAPAAEAFGLKVMIPPLRERPEDLLDLIPHLLTRRGATARMAPSAMQALMRYDWPGNVAELDSLIRALLTRKRTTDIAVADLPPSYHASSRRLRRIEQVERTAIVQALLEVDGNKSRAADLLEIGRATLYRKIRSYGLDLEVSTG